MRGHAEIVGAGLAGLGMSILLAKSGWTVQVHEKNDVIAEVGAGIYLKKNGLQSLKAMGLHEKVIAQGTQLTGQTRLGGKGKLIESRPSTKDSPMWCLPREELIQIMRLRALDVGVSIRYNSHVMDVEPAGTVALSSGEALDADLVVVADGVGSGLRGRLGLGKNRERLTTRVTRFLIPSRDLTPDAELREYWSGSRRIALAPCGPESTYVYAICRSDDAAALVQPLDVDNWAESFPSIRKELAILAEHPAVQHTYPLVECKSWSKGVVVLVGDAAHALPPTLGQGANLAMSNALGLASTLQGASSVKEALAAWEKEFRHFTDVTQKWSVRYDRLTWKWPNGMDGARKRLLWALTLPMFGRMIHIADGMVSETRLTRVDQ